MQIFDSHQDLRVVIQTTDGPVVDVRAMELEVEDALGRFTVCGSDEVLSALVRSTIVVRKRDGGEYRIQAGWGSLTAAGGQVRIALSDARVRHVEPQRQPAGQPLKIAV